jgi:hypothetical protein
MNLFCIDGGIKISEMILDVRNAEDSESTGRNLA